MARYLIVMTLKLINSFNLLNIILVDYVISVVHKVTQKKLEVFQ